jgi:hypothetical protein
MHEYDKSTKWLIQDHGDSILRMGGIQDIATWRPLQAELVQHRRLPDGLIEVRHHGEDGPDYYILEVATYPEARVIKQVARDTALVFLDRDVVPEVLVVFLHPRGNAAAADGAMLRSRRGWTNWPLSWRVVKLWTIPAANLLSSGDVGLVPWVPLTEFSDRPERILREWRDRIDRDAPANERENLLAVTQVLAGLRYNEPGLFQIFGGRKAMIESPVLKELRAEWTHEGAVEAVRQSIVKFLEARFGPDARALEAELKSVGEDRLDDMLKLEAKCRSLASFRKRLSL